MIPTNYTAHLPKIFRPKRVEQAQDARSGQRRQTREEDAAFEEQDSPPSPKDKQKGTRVNRYL